MTTYTSATPFNLVVSYHPGGPLAAGATENSPPGWYLHDGAHSIKVKVLKPFSNEEMDATPPHVDGANPLDPEGYYINREAALTRVGCLIASGEVTLERSNDNCVWLHPAGGRRTEFSVYAANRAAVIQLYAMEQAKARGYDWPWEPGAQ